MKSKLFTLEATNGRARCGTLYLKHGNVETPIFMPVGTKGAMRALDLHQLSKIGQQIMLCNTFHLMDHPGTKNIQSCNGIHKYMNWENCILTDSGGFQMVSLASLLSKDERGVIFNSPYNNNKISLTPEESIRAQNEIGADIIMAMDDVIPATCTAYDQVKDCMERSHRWLERCILAHQRIDDQYLFGIVHGGLYLDLRKVSIDFMSATNLSGYAIGGLSGGESKTDFINVVELSSNPSGGLPMNKPRYLMGVGYPLDIVVCVALGCDMFDCVYPSRTARFGIALTSRGPVQIRLSDSESNGPLDQNCSCYTCLNYSKSYIYKAFTRFPVGRTLVTLHNLAYMRSLCCDMRRAIMNQKFPEFVAHFLLLQYPLEAGIPPPAWALIAFDKAGIPLTHIPWKL